MTDFLIFLSRFLRLLHFVRGALGALLLLLGVCALALMWAEGLPLGDALYLTAVTGLTIGYGDIAPASPLGRIACVTAGLIGVVFVGLVVAVATRALAQAVKDNSEGR
ncbi:two pore domain potassium channel family protein [Pikeienuella piscinae]|uniref:Two pore domain potassium channel family protein n=1 Tax=Pikeienuella piscinae TaxID=2748098 RepID=A0A7L5BX94_9RHOB|nr:potassium channel family protein [Pikeienuella piscinae]QIE55147.1 two pore domain potassium channel family protein [Pikeienuella piscinae]